MDLIEIGSALREARERKGLSIETVEEKTKIAPSVIVALEEGNRDRFPHPVYARGFVRSYAMLLGLDEVDLCTHFSREYPVSTESDPPEHHASRIKVRAHDSKQVVTAVRVVAVLGILALGALGWYAYDVYQSRQAQAPVVEEAAPTPQAQTQTLSPESTPAPLTQMQEVAAEPQLPLASAQAPNATSEGLAEAAPGAPGASDATEKPAAEGDTAVPAAPAPASVPAPAVAPAPAPAAQEDAPKPAAAERTLVIRAHAASWLQARPDDKVQDYFLRKGESVTITFRQSLSIKFGNAGGVKLELDGKAYPFEAALGEVRTLVVE